MVKRLLTLSLIAFALGARAQYQVPNSDFETNWSSDNEPGSGWYSFPSAGGTWSSFSGSSKANTVKLTGDDARNGGTSVRLKSRNIAGKKANGNLTTGRINMGSTTPANSANYNYTDLSGSTNHAAFTGHPDAFEYWAKFKRGETGDYNARCHVIIHGDCNYKDPSETTENINKYKIAEATVYATPCTDWTKFSGKFEYASPTAPGNNTYVLASFTTNPTAGGSENDIFDVDDVKFIYWHALSALSYEGASLSFSENTTSYDLSSVFYDEAKLSYTVKGRAATASKSYNASTGVLTIRVEGEDFGTDASLFQNPQSYTEYTIQFKHKVSEKTYTEDLYVTLDGFTFDKEVAAVLVEKYSDNTIDFSLNNFMLGELPVGNIAVKNIAVASDNSFVFNGGIQITPGNVDGIDEGDWMGPVITLMCGEEGVPISLNGKFVDDDHIIVTIDINLTEVEGLNQMINVHLGYARATMAVNATAKYGTFCAPFAVEIPTGVTASKVTSVDANGQLNLTDLSATIPANTPVVLFAESGLETVEFFGVAEAGTPKEGLLTGVYAETPAPVGSYVLQNLSSGVAFYQVATGQQPTVGANRCYLTAPDSDVKALVFPDGTMTSISEIQAADEKAVIYDLSGRRVSKATKGIYITNGKKFLVK